MIPRIPKTRQCLNCKAVLHKPPQHCSVDLLITKWERRTYFLPRSLVGHSKGNFSLVAIQQDEFLISIISYVLTSREGSGHRMLSVLHFVYVSPSIKVSSVRTELVDIAWMIQIINWQCWNYQKIKAFVLLSSVTIQWSKWIAGATGKWKGKQNFRSGIPVCPWNISVSTCPLCAH